MLVECVKGLQGLGRAFKVSIRIHSFSVLHFHASNSVSDLDPVSRSQGVGISVSQGYWKGKKKEEVIFINHDMSLSLLCHYRPDTTAPVDWA